MDAAATGPFNTDLEGAALENSHARRFSNGRGDAWLQDLPKKGRAYFKKQREEFEKAGLLSAAEAFRASEPGTPVTDDMKRLQLGFLKADAIERPVFTKLTETDSDRTGALYTDEVFTLFINIGQPYPECYAATGKYGTSGGSLVHMLACPNERIYNAVSLRSTDVDMLEHMKNKVLELMQDDGFKQKCIEQLDPKMAAFPDLTDEYAADRDKFLSTGPDQMRFYFHIHPNHSVGHLHMHCLENNLRTSFIHEHKNAKYEDIVAVLQS